MALEINYNEERKTDGVYITCTYIRDGITAVPVIYRIRERGNGGFLLTRLRRDGLEQYIAEYGDYDECRSQIPRLFKRIAQIPGEC